MAEKYLTRWEPIRDLFSLRTDMDRLVESFFGLGPKESNGFWMPTLDVEEENDNIIVKAELPGMRKEDIKITVNDGTLSISGERRQESETKNKTFHRIERSYGKFSRNVALPGHVDPAKVTATYKDGVLSVTLPKPESAKSKHVDIQVQ